jgi:hypothetical protein
MGTQDFIMRILKIFLFLFLLSVHVDDVNSAIFQLDSDRFSSRTKNTGIYSYDFRITVIEHDGILIDAVTVTDRNKQRPFVPFDNGGHLLFTSGNVFLNVTKGIIAMSFPAGKGRLIRLVAGAGSHIEFEPDSFTITSSVSNASAVTAILEGIEFLILPGETTRFIETDIIPASVNVALNQNTGGLISVAIFGSAHLDVNHIKIDSLLLESPVLKEKAKSNHPATIDHLNDDSYPDLMVEFEANKSPLNGNFNNAILKGRLSDGTIIKGIPVLDFKF